MNTQEIVKLLEELLEQAYSVEAETGTMPGADEALSWAIDAIRQSERSTQFGE
jgi:hypothetical protein